jgi:hypothetical protein
MGQKMVCFEALRGTRSRQDESIEVDEVGSPVHVTYYRSTPLGSSFTRQILLISACRAHNFRFLVALWGFSAGTCAGISRAEIQFRGLRQRIHAGHLPSSRTSAGYVVAAE